MFFWRQNRFYVCAGFGTEEINMTSKVKRQELTEEFIEIWREERSLWDVKATIYGDRNAKAKSYSVFKEKLDMEGWYFHYYVFCFCAKRDFLRRVPAGRGG